MEKIIKVAGFIILLAVASITAGVLLSGLEKEVVRQLLSYITTIMTALILAMPFITRVRKDEKEEKRNSKGVS